MSSLSVLKKYFFHKDSLIILGFCIGIIASLTVFFDLFLPFWIAIVIAYLQQYTVRLYLPFFSYTTSVYIAMFVNCFILAGLSFLLIPFLIEELSEFQSALPTMISVNSEVLSHLLGIPISLEEQLGSFLTHEGQKIGSYLLGFAAASLPSLVHGIVYCVTIPILVFFLNHDKEIILKSLSSSLGQSQPIRLIGHKISLQMDYYIRGKIVHMLIIGFLSYLLFAYFSIPYSFLLSIPNALSVFIPFLGTALATIPLILIGLAKMGLNSTFGVLIFLYALLQAFESNILVPMIFSQAHDLHPMIILISILVLGHFLGVLGVFIAIPFVACLKVLIQNWPIQNTTGEHHG